MRFLQRSMGICVVLLLLVGCSNAYNQAYFKAVDSALGIHKRDLLVHRVEKARESQEEAKEQFKTALEKFSALTNFDGGALEAKYKQIQSEYDDSKDKAEAIHKRITDVEDVAQALFAEWQGELEQYSSAGMRRNSEKKLRATQSRYEKLISAMKRAESKIQPVLEAFEDQTLYLKHNLNAKAIASLKDELQSVENDIAALIREMEKSINEADSFIQSMEASNSEA